MSELEAAAAHEEIQALERERDQLNAIIADTNSALNRAGIVSAYTFAEAIDHLAAERDRLRAALGITCRWFGGIEAEVLTVEQRAKLAEFRKLTFAGGAP